MPESDKLTHSKVSSDAQRLDKWLWFARVAKTRTLAAGLVAGGKVRVNRVRTTKAAQAVKLGDVITVSVARGVRVLRVVAGGTRRGPAAEAALLFEEIVPLQTTKPAVPEASSGIGSDGPAKADLPEEHVGLSGGPETVAGSGRPTKRDRRLLDRLRGDGND